MAGFCTRAKECGVRKEWRSKEKRSVREVRFGALFGICRPPCRSMHLVAPEVGGFPQQIGEVKLPGTAAVMTGGNFSLAPPAQSLQYYRLET